METMFEFFEVGGCVRDELIDPNTIVKDVDFTVVAHGDNDRDPFLNLIAHLESEGFKIWLLQPDFLTIRAQVPEEHVLRSRTRDADFVLARKDVDCSGGRSATVVAAGTLEDDLGRRDFTMNAIAKNVSGELVDPFNGQADIADKTIRFVGDPMTRIREDAIRILRAFRFKLKLGFDIEAASQEALLSVEGAELLLLVSVERRREELDKMLLCDTLGTIEFIAQLPTHTKEALFTDSLRLMATMKEKKK